VGLSSIELVSNFPSFVQVSALGLLELGARYGGNLLANISRDCLRHAFELSIKGKTFRS
jgi:hypothetical protein